MKDIICFEVNDWEKFTTRFEDLKCVPLETYKEICQKLGISWSDQLIEKVGNKGFYMKPVYHDYEECLSGLDRMKISVLQSPYQKRFGYPYLNVNEFTRKELQNMFMRDWRFEQERVTFYNEDDKMEYRMEWQQLLEDRLWKLRQQERVELLEANHQ